MKGAVYILTNKNNTTLYVGVTRNIVERIKNHTTRKYPGSFTSKYNLFKLVYFKWFDTIGEAIKEEKRIKGGSRIKKVQMIELMNPKWEDLSEGLSG